MTTLFLHFFLFLTTTCVTTLIPAVHSHCIEDQQLSLLHFKKSLVFYSPHSSKLITWSSSTDCCSWLGVTCNTNGHVVGLDISNEPFSCNIDNSSSLFQLQHLERLNLAENYFDGSQIPSAIGKLKNLRYLNLSYACSSGEIPIEISRLTRLAILDLSTYDTYWGVKVENTNLSMVFQKLTELTELNLNGVNISAQAPEWCQAISSSLLNLRVLSLSNCHLSGPICDSLTKLQSLSEIYLDYNNFYAPIPRLFGNFSKLTSLNLRGCNLQGTFPKEIFQIPCLQTIHLSMNEELGGSFPEFPKNGSLQSMDLTGTKFSGILPNSIGNLKKLSSISLSGCSFTGSVPKSIENLTKLVHLDMSQNKFNGPISAIHWESLVNLESLHLRNNLLNGSIPSSIFSLPLRGELVLSNNQFSGQVPEFSNTSSYLHIDTLDLRNNNLEGQIPISIFNLQGLQYLNLSSNNFSGFPFKGPQQPTTLSIIDLSHNQIQGKIPTSIFNLQGLQYLNLSSNNFSGFPFKGPQQPTTLSIIDLSHNQIQGQIPNWIWRLNSLQELNLSCNSLDTLEAPILNSTYLVSSLDLHSNQLQGQIPMFVSGRYLDYSRNNFSFSIPTGIGNFISAATYLSLSNNNLHGAIPKSICNTSVKVLDLSNNSLSGIIPQCLIQLQSLSVLNLRRNNLTGTIPDHFLQNYKLQTLDLSRNQIQGQFPKSLNYCSSLEVLNLGNNQITDNFPCFLMSKSPLHVLVLRFNKFYGSIGCPKTNDSWPVLQIIDLAHNNLSGEILGSTSLTWQAMMANEDDSSTNLGFTSHPIRSSYYRDKYGNGPGIHYYTDSITATTKGLELDLVKIPTIFTLIDFSSNNFNGSIPEEMGQLKSLHVLNLSSNALRGEIPSSIGNMRQLESLDLSQNHLRGQIPQQFANLTFLSFLNISNNQLTGRIPTSTQFSTFPNTSFEGNQGLWGPPLTVDLVVVSPPPTPSNPNLGDEIDWDIISVEIGFTCGFGIAIGSLLCKRWRKWFYRAMCNLLFKKFPQLEQKFGNHRRHVYVNTRWRH